MEVRAEFKKFHDVEADALVVTIYEGEKAEEGALRDLDERSGGLLRELIGSDEMRGKQGEMVYVHKPGDIRARRLLLVGGGKREDSSLDGVRKVTGSAARFLRGKGARSMAMLRRSQLDIGSSAQAAVEGALIGLFEPDRYKTEDKEERRITELILVAASPGSENELARGVERGRIIGDAINLAQQYYAERPWINNPADSRAQKLTQEYNRLTDPNGLYRLPKEPSTDVLVLEKMLGSIDRVRKANNVTQRNDMHTENGAGGDGAKTVVTTVQSIDKMPAHFHSFWEKTGTPQADREKEAAAYWRRQAERTATK